MEMNPYASPSSPMAVQVPQFGVEGRALVVPTNTVLPPVCIRTNQPVSEADMVRKDFYWCPPWVALLMLVSGCVLILVYFVARKRFTITYGLSPELRKSYRKWLMAKLLAVIGLFFAIPLSAGSEIGVFIVLVLFLVAVVSLFIGNIPLSVANHRRGLFWVKGCSAEYLARLETEAVSATVV